MRLPEDQSVINSKALQLHKSRGGVALGNLSQGKFPIAEVSKAKQDAPISMLEWRKSRAEVRAAECRLRIARPKKIIACSH